MRQFLFDTFVCIGIFTVVFIVSVVQRYVTGIPTYIVILPLFGGCLAAYIDYKYTIKF